MVIVFAAIALVGFLVYHFSVHTIRNTRPLAGANIDISSAVQTQSEASFSIDPAQPRVLFGATNDTGRETVRVHTSTDGGKTWAAATDRLCREPRAHGQPRTAIDRSGREVIAFLAASYYGDSLTPYLVVTSRASATARWSPLVRVTPPAWKYGFDDWTALAVDGQSGRLYLAWARSLSAAKACSCSARATTTARPGRRRAKVSDGLDHPHLASVAVAPHGDVYVAGIDAKVGLWITRSHDGGGSFGAPRGAAPLLSNPSADGRIIENGFDVFTAAAPQRLPLRP